MLQAIRDAKEGKRHPKEVKIIWMVKSRREFCALRLLLTYSPPELGFTYLVRPRAFHTPDTQGIIAHPRHPTLYPPRIHLASATS